MAFPCAGPVQSALGMKFSLTHTGLVASTQPSLWKNPICFSSDEMPLRFVCDLLLGDLLGTGGRTTFFSEQPSGQFRKGVGGGCKSTLGLNPNFQH